MYYDYKNVRKGPNGILIGVLIGIVVLVLAFGVWAVLKSPSQQTQQPQVENTLTPQPQVENTPTPQPQVENTLTPQPQVENTPTPQPQETEPLITTYTVMPGDYLLTIASKFGVSVEDLARANPQISDLNTIIVGQVINLPQPSVVARSASSDTGPYGEEDVTQKWENLSPPTVSGGNIVQRGEFWQFADNFLRVIKTENGETSWSSLIRVDGWNPSMTSTVGGISFYWPEDYVFTGQGNGTITFVMKADNTEGGYDYAASYGDTGKLSLYVTGINGIVYLSKDNGVTWKSFELSSGKPGIDFPKDSTVMFRIDLGTNGGEGMYTLSIGPQDSTGDAPAY